MTSDQPTSVVVIGASAGGVEALTALARALPADFPACVAVVLHLPASGTSVLPQILNRAGALPALAATDGEAFAPGRIYVAPPDHHLIVGRDELTLSHGPRENGHRPAIDTLFRTAALSYGPRTIGVVLSGTLDDGVAGLAVIKGHGGIAVVQDPDDAAYRGMPDAALQRVAVDHAAPMRELPALLVELAGGTPPDPLTVVEPPEPIPPMHQHGDTATGIICPECGGAIWEIDESGVQRFRCRIGHSFTEQSLLTLQGADVEAALWTALRSLEERAALLQRIAQRAQDAGSTRTAARFREKAVDAERQAEIIRAGVLPVSLDLDEAAEPGEQDVAS